ncbi:MAG: prolipoprotein diacylglyceryl transferase, partial [Pseudomonadota bacterium]
PSFYTVGPLVQIDLGFVQIPTYYLVISLAYCLGIVWLYKRSEDRNLSQKQAMDICLIIIFGGFLGARLSHILFELPSYYWQNPMQVFAIWQGGFVFYGGAIAAYVGGFLYIRKFKLTFWLWHDTAAPVVAFCYAFGRTACFLTGCCYGKVCDLPWAFPMKQVDIASGAVSTVHRHPTQIYAVLAELAIVVFLLWYERRRPKLGSVFLVWVLLHSIGRLVMEAFRDDPRGPSLWGLSVSTQVSLLLFALSLVVFISRSRQA